MLAPHEGAIRSDTIVKKPAQALGEIGLTDSNVLACVLAAPPIQTRLLGSLNQLADQIVACQRCRRLRTYCCGVAQTKRRAFTDWEYWGKPVAGFGDPRARLWIVGLAPAAHG